MFEIEFYRTEKGKIPVEEFIDSLDVKMQGKVLRTIGLLIEHGTRIGEPYSSRLAKGIFELRVQQANNISRILYFFVRDQKVILTHGFIKKTQKTPPEEITRAERYKADYERRHKNDE